ncbi:hypothetical protein DEU56DRAFT_759946 [Suillus clintonianus]|uniref:uncharacterized protein n=1 Tax=Suillus clintonianus TaxID=1904413 RepID=UPI001B883437|nr:uncharacterized protein DEU56DRAFT_759946 [Suillus clintonianus]KAG2123733.1 hypothetical protein DEU56DRAFT_759946 [Suillus clintonianus]
MTATTDRIDGEAILEIEAIDDRPQPRAGQDVQTIQYGYHDKVEPHWVEPRILRVWALGIDVSVEFRRGMEKWIIMEVVSGIRIIIQADSRSSYTKHKYKEKHTKEMMCVKEPWVLVEMGMVVETEQEPHAELLAGSLKTENLTLQNLQIAEQNPEVEEEHLEGGADPRAREGTWRPPRSRCKELEAPRPRCAIADKLRF